MSLRDYLFERSIPEPNSGCWLWAGMWSSTNYGTANVKIDGTWTRVPAHWLAVEDTGDGRHALHRCDVKPCVNPSHVYRDTRFDNGRDWSKACAEGRSHGRGPDLRPRKRHATA